MRVADGEVPLEGEGHDHEDGGHHGEVGEDAEALGQRHKPLGLKKKERRGS